MTGPIRDVESAVRELGALPMPAGPAPTVDELLAENARLKRKVDSLKALQERDDAEYAQAIKERDRALELVAELAAVRAERDCLAMAVLFVLQWSGGTPFELRKSIDEILATMPDDWPGETA